jgi:hypothetical protein
MLVQQHSACWWPARQAVASIPGPHSSTGRAQPRGGERLTCGKMAMCIHTSRSPTRTWRRWTGSTSPPVPIARSSDPGGKRAPQRRLRTAVARPRHEEIGVDALTCRVPVEYLSRRLPAPPQRDGRAQSHPDRWWSPGSRAAWGAPAIRMCSDPDVLGAQRPKSPCAELELTRVLADGPSD